MDQHKPAQENTINEIFAGKFAGLACLWAVVYVIAGRIGEQIPATAGGFMFLMKAAVMAPVLAALRMTYRNPAQENWVRISCRILFGVMCAALVILLVLALM